MYTFCCRGVALVALAGGLCLSAHAADPATSARREFTPSEHLMHTVIAEHFGLTHAQVMDLHGRGYSYEDIATAANIAARSGRPLSEVIAARDGGTQWPAIATRYGVDTADAYRPFYRYTGPDAVLYEYNFYRVYSGIPTADYERYRRMGYSPRDIGMAYNVSRRTGRQPDDVFRMLDRGMTWDQIAQENRLALSDIQTPEARVAGARMTMAPDTMTGSGSFLPPPANIDWSRAYELTPLEMKRLRAKGLRDRDIFVAANAAEVSGRDVDYFARRLTLGHTAEVLAQELAVATTRLTDPKPAWQTPEWERAVEAGHWSAPAIPMQSSVTPTR